MGMRTKIANKLRELEEFVNENGIEKEMIISIYQAMDGSFHLVYYED